MLKTRKFIPLLVVAAGLLAYQNSFTGPFIFDDVPHIVENPRIRQLWPPWEIFMHTSRPVVMLSVAVNYALGGLNPWGYHLFNVGVHILAALTLYGVVRRTLVSEAWRSRWDGAAPRLAGVISLIWLVHPLQTESVTYVIHRGESLMGLFYLLSLYCVIRGHEPPRSIWWSVGAVVSCALGMASKPVMVTAPVVILLYDRAFLAKSWREVLEQRRTLYACLAATWLLLPLLLANGAWEWKASAGFAYKAIPPLRYILTQPGVILHYLRLAFWPHPLCFDYGWPPAQTLGDALPGLMVVGVLLAATVWAWWRQPALGFLGVWFFMILAPTSSFVPVADPAVEHRMYLPLAAVAAMVVVGGFGLGRDLLSMRQQTRRMLAGGVGGALVLVLAILTIQRNRDYNSEVAIWLDTVQKCPNNPRARYNLGHALAQAGRVQEAIGHYEEALRIEPDRAGTHNNLGIALAQAGRVQEAIAHYEQALRLKPDYAEAHNDLGNALLQAGKLEDAMAHYERALRLKPDYAEAHNNLGNALLRAGKPEDAMAHYKQALQLKPGFAEAHYNLGVALGQVGKLEDAIGHYQQALRIKPDYAEAHNSLGAALVRLGRVQEAIGHWEQALKMKPDDAKVHNDLGAALMQVGKLEDAIGHFEQALQIKPDFAEVHNNFGAALVRRGRVHDAIGHFEQALRLKPDYADAHYNLGVTLEQAGKITAAIGHYKQALRIKPDYTEAQNRLARLRATQ